jgi:DNA-binding transcriptional MerR regulator
MSSLLSLGLTPLQVSGAFDIDAASKACGVNPGVLRMWELRYGWPRPARLPNGYRYFTRFEIDELKRMSALVKSGMLISKLIKDGMPKWPESVEVKPIERLPLTKRLPIPVGQAIALRQQLIDALVTMNTGRAWELLQRCAWEMRPVDQVLAGWLPTLVAFEEYRVAGKPLPKQEGLLSLIRDSIKTALGRMAVDPRPLWVVPQSESDLTLAYLAALIISQRGTVARPWIWDGLPKGGAAFVSVATTAAWKSASTACHRGHLTLLDAKQRNLVALVSATEVAF